ncbi:D-glycero-beta-D-manno-heptose 1,7-bisphosphate 7-phosphatase [Marinobacter sp. 1Y8]
MLVILDRDGVINHYHGDYICSADEWHAIPSSIEAIARLTQAGHQVAIATNQSGIARGFYDQPALQAMHHKMLGLVESAGGHIDHISYCPHLPDTGCACRKPETGLLIQIRDALGLEGLNTAIMVGDSLKDLQAGQAADCQAVALVRTGNGQETERFLTSHPMAGVTIWDDLASLVDRLVGAGISTITDQHQR